MSALRDTLDACELLERTAAIDGGERWRARHRALGIDLELVRWRADGAERDRLRGWLARRARLAHPRLAPLIAAGEDSGTCWAAVEAGDTLAAGAGWRATWTTVIALAEGLAALHGVGDGLGDVDGASLRYPDAAPRLGLPTRAPSACDPRADVAALAALARRLLGAESEDWFLPTRVRAALDAAALGRCAHAGEFARACAAALVDEPRARRLLVVAVPSGDGVAVHAEEPGRGHATRHLPAHAVAALAEAWADARAARPTATAARRALGDADPITALAARFAADALPEPIAARLWEPDWRIEVADAGTALPWRLLAGAATATRDDVRIAFGEGVGADAVAPVALALACGAGVGRACAAAAKRAFARRWWWPAVRAPRRGPLLLAGDLAAARARLDAAPELCRRVALAVVAGDGPPLPLREEAAQIVLDPAAPRGLWRAIAEACCTALARGGAAGDAARAADAVLRARSAPCDPLLCGAMVHGAADMRVEMARRLPVAR